MKLDSNDIELIEKSIEGSLDSKESAMFMERYNTSETFREHVNFQRSLLSSLEANNKVKLKAELTQMLNEVGTKKQVVSISKKWYMFAATITILAGVLWIFSLTSNNQQLFDKYYEPFPAQGFVRGDASKSDTDEILQLYASAEYKETINRILALNETGRTFEGQMLYLGNSYLALSQNEKAIQALQIIDKESRYYPDAQWYLALAFLEKGDKEESTNILKALSLQNTVYTTSIHSLLEDLE